MRSLRVFVRRVALAVVLSVATLAGAGLPGFGPSVAHAEVVSNIVVSGNGRIAASTVLNYVTIKPGKTYSAFDVDASVKALFATGLFSDVTITRSGNSLVVRVVENPIVNTVIFTGNKKVKSEVLVQLAQTKPRDVLTQAKLQGDVQRISDYYSTQGRSEATVEPKVTQLSDNRVDVAFVIHEGMRTGVGSVEFIGNHAFSTSRLRSVVATKQHNWLSWLTRKDIYDEAKLDADQDALRRFYMSHGYADFQVLSAEHTFDEAKGRYTVVFTVDEGARYKFSSINIDSSIPGLKTAGLMHYIKTYPGRTFNAEDVEKSIENLTVAVSNLGFSFVQVRPRGDRNYQNHTIAITYLIDEGPRVYIERINIAGNTKTRDYVIRREFSVSEGDPYNQVLINQAQQRLKDLGYFKTVNITTEPGSSPDKIIVDVQVQDDQTGNFSVGGGLTTTGLVAEVSLDEKNFLGRGQQLRIAVGWGVDQQTYNISFTDPYFLGYHLSAGVDAYYAGSSKVSWRPFDSEVLGGGLRLGVPVTDNFKVLLNYKLYQTTITNTSRKTAVYFPDGVTLTSLAGYGLVYSTIDSTADPREGTYLSFSQAFAGLGGDEQYVQSIADARYYHELFPDQDVVGFVHLSGGNIQGLGQPVTIFDNFFKGPETVRGFAPYGFGPVDKATGVPIGGKDFWAATAEVQFPLPGISPDLGLRGAFFADAGNLFDVDVPQGGGPIVDDKTIRSSVGASILWASPLGLLRADFAQVLTKASTDSLQWFYFSAGTHF